MLSVQGSDKATRGHLKSQALLHELKQKHLMQHKQAKQQVQLPAKLHQMPAHSRGHKVIPKQHNSSKDMQTQDTTAAAKTHMPVRTRAQGGRKRRK